MKCSLGISNFLEGISSLSHSVVFLYFFALIASLGWEDALEEEMATHSSVLAWRQRNRGKQQKGKD